VQTGFIVLFIIITAVVLVVKLPVFGRLPQGERRARIIADPHYSKGSFQNLSPTPVKPEDVSYLTIIRSVLKKNKKSTPDFALPSVKPDFSTERSGTKIIWFGHSSYFIKAAGLRILVDPVFSKTTSPFSFVGNTNYPGMDFVHAEDFPEIDVLLITHDHYDHLDYPTILKLKSKTKLFVTSLGVGAHLERWGVPKADIRELVWGEKFLIKEGVSLRALPARHFSGRLFKRNQTLWSSFILRTPTRRIYLGGDSGYDNHFAQIGTQYGPFDLAVLECGQYNAYWPYIHMFPEQTVQAAIDLQARVLLPVHWGKFTLAQHDWDEPVERALAASKGAEVQLTTPLPGESVWLQDDLPTSNWWRK
jgi:L-ascorbate metabolism protein UlaG (beta-lactamase superfamily)